MIKDLLGRIWKAVKEIKWRWVFIYPIYTLVIYARFLKLFGSRILGAAVACVILLIVNHFVRRVE
jgi:hypothetical protein